MKSAAAIETTIETINMLYITCGSQEEAESIASVLIEERLVACANILPGATSLYMWNQEVTRATETILIAKTTTRRVGETRLRILELHSYDCPCVISLPVSGVNSEYAEWIEKSVSPPISPSAGK